MDGIGDVMALAFRFFVVLGLVAGLVIGGCTTCVALRYTAHVSIERRP